VNSSSQDESDHLTDIDVAAYIDKKLLPDQRERIEDHLSNCPDCRKQVLETRELLEQMRRPKKLLVGGALAAAVAVVLLIVRPAPPDENEPPRLRTISAEAPLAAYGPIGSAPRTGLRFVWSAAPGAESYRLTVNRADGNPVWSLSGPDTVMALPDSVVLRSNERYFWVADALLRDGTTRSTGLREFGVVR
jgi:anti-sigma factor RsiW